ncbi:MAG: hypothetical protein R3D67_03335 [Hyphomicrobiaceae bacterium]
MDHSRIAVRFLKKERFLFQRLDLDAQGHLRRLLHAAGYVPEMWRHLWFGDHKRTFIEWVQRRGLRLITAALMSLPIFVLYFGLKYWDLSLLHYRRRVRERCCTYFALPAV